MGRKKFVEADRQYLMPDHQYQSKLVSKFINCMMLDGKKSRAQKVFYDAMDKIAKEIPDSTPIQVFETAIDNVKPMLEVRSKRVGGASYQVPMQVRPRRQQSLAFRWILAAARGKKGKPMALRLAAELLDAFKKEGAAMTTRENVHRMAEANKAFAHFAW
jgi:small subunit ribosomal protein S7